jgi:hypothetical protein
VQTFVTIFANSYLASTWNFIKWKSFSLENKTKSKKNYKMTGLDCTRRKVEIFSLENKTKSKKNDYDRLGLQEKERAF